MNEIPRQKKDSMKRKAQADAEALRIMARHSFDEGNGNLSFILNQVADHIDHGNDWDIADILRATYTGEPLSPENKFKGKL